MSRNKNKKNNQQAKINKNLEKVNTSSHISEQQRKNDNSYNRSESLDKTDQTIEEKNKSNEITHNKTIKQTYTTEYNLTYIIYTHALFFSSVLGIIILYFYLRDIDSIQLLRNSLSSINTILFIGTFLILSLVTFVIATLPSVLIICYNIKTTENFFILPY